MVLRKAPAFASHSEASVPSGGVSKTRLCIKNLPQHLTEPELRQFLHRQWKTSPITITDCRILKTTTGQSRRIAFVGLLTPEQADVAVQQLHRSYCQTSRLQVEFALLPSKSRTVPTEEKETEAVSSGNSATVPAPTTIESTKKSEFVAATTRTTRPFWSNDDDAHTPPQIINDTVLEAPIDEGKDDKEEGDNVHCENPPSAMDFLRSKQVSIQELDETPTTTQNAILSSYSNPPKVTVTANEIKSENEEVFVFEKFALFYYRSRDSSAL